MEKHKFFSSLLILLCLSHASVCAQQRKEISREEAQQACNKAFGNLNKFPYRKIIEGKNSSSDEKNLILAQKGIEEFVPPDKKHIRYETKPFPHKLVSDKFFVSETFWINGFKYIKDERAGINEWQKSAEVLKPIEEQQFPPASDENVRYYLTENVNLSGQNVNLYELIIESKFQRKDSQGEPPKEEVKSFKARFWINDKGLLLRWEEIMDNDIWIPYRKTVRNVYVYEYDSNIKIEAPKIN